MKWSGKIKYPKYPKAGDKRMRRAFLLLPRTVYDFANNVWHTRWLEWAWIEEEYTCPGWMDPDYWAFVKFVEGPSG
jgi:hypothetical protein